MKQAKNDSNGLDGKNNYIMLYNHFPIFSLHTRKCKKRYRKQIIHALLEVNDSLSQLTKVSFLFGLSRIAPTKKEKYLFFTKI